VQAGSIGSHQVRPSFEPHHFAEHGERRRVTDRRVFKQEVILLRLQSLERELPQSSSGTMISRLLFANCL
jgi:hypothetical protein